MRATPEGDAMTGMTDQERAEHIGAAGLLDEATGHLPGAVELRRNLNGGTTVTATFQKRPVPNLAKSNRRPPGD